MPFLSRKYLKARPRPIATLAPRASRSQHHLNYEALKPCHRSIIGISKSQEPNSVSNLGMGNPQDAKITVHWLNKSRGQRIIWLLEELQLEYEIKVYKRDKNFRAPASLKEIHALGKSPAVTIEVPGTEKPLVLAESGTVIEYLSEHFGHHLIPNRYPEGKDGQIGAETEEWLRYRFLMHYGEGSLMTFLVIALVTNNIKNAPVPFFLRPITRGIAGKIDSSFVNPEIKTNLDFLENYLATSPNNGQFFCGPNLSGADVMMSFCLEAGFKRAPITETTYPKLHGYVRALQAREPYIRAGERVSEASGEKYVPFSDIDL